MIFTPYSMVGFGMYRDLNLAIPLTYLKFRRDAERAADFFGVQYLYQAGYDPESYPQLLERIWPKVSQGKTVQRVFSPFPPLPDRLKAIRTEIDRLQPKRDAAVVSSSEFQAIQERLRALQFQKLAVPQPDPAKPTLRKPPEKL
jgi:predicted Zn-dependent protease